MKKYKCFCCGNLTLQTRGNYDICPVCFWEDDANLILDRGEMRSSANHGMTLKEGQQNYKEFGACEREMLPYVRKPKSFERK